MNGSSYFLDTNIFLRAITKDEKKQSDESLRLLQKISENELTVNTSSIVLAELNWTLASFYHYTKSDIARVLRGITNAKNIKISDYYAPAQAVELYERHNVKLVDCLIASHPQIANDQMIIVSYDKDFDKLSVKRVEPSIFI